MESKKSLKSIVGKTSPLFPLIVLITICIANYCVNNWLSPFIKNLIYIGSSGGIGGSICFMLLYYKSSSMEMSLDTNYLKNIFVTIISTLFGIFVFFFIYGGLIYFFNINKDISKFGILFYCSLTFSVGLLVSFISTTRGWIILRSYFLNKTTLSGINLFLILIIYIIIAIYTNYNFKGSMVKTIIFTFVSGGLGGTLYCIIDFYKSIGENKGEIYMWSWWYFFRPITSAVLGVFAFFLIYAGLLVINNTTQGIMEVRSIIFYSALSFVLGYSYSSFFTYIEKLANIIFKEPKNKEGASK